MRIAVIVSTYNSPSRLERVLCGYSIQTHREFDLIVADDGSGPETREALQRVRAELGLELRHVWQEDRGFRKCAILNRAVEATDAEYLIFTDGDCVPRRDFVATHLTLAEPGRYLSGGCFRLAADATRHLTRADVLEGRATDLRFFGRTISRGNLRRYRLVIDHPMARIFDAVTPTRPTWNGHNSSCWRRDLLAVNGFDERMCYGGEDREFGERLVHAGVRPKQVRHRAVCVHLWHDRDYEFADGWRQNHFIRRQTADSRARYTDHGIQKRASGERS